MNLDPRDWHVVEIGSQNGRMSTDIPFTVGDAVFTTDLVVPSPNLQIKVKDGNLDVARAWVNIRPAAALPGQFDKGMGVETDLNGLAKFKVTPGADYVLTDIFRAGQGVQINKLILASDLGGDPIVVNLQSAIDLTVNNEAGSTITSAWVTLFPDENGAAAMQRPIHGNINGEGLLRINLQDGTYHLMEIGAPGRMIRTDIKFKIDSGATFVWENNAWVPGSVLNPPAPNVIVTVIQGGQPLQHAMVQMRPAIGAAAGVAGVFSVWAETDADGIARLLIPSAANWELFDIGYGPVVSIHKPVQVPVGEIVLLTVRLDAGVLLHMKDESGTDLTQSWVRVVPDDGADKPTLNPGTIANAGTDAIAKLSLPDGKYWVVEIGANGRVVRYQKQFTVVNGAAVEGDNAFVTVQLPSANTTAVVTLDGTPVDYAEVWVVEATVSEAEYADKVQSFQAGPDGTVRLVVESGKDYVIKEVEAKVSGGAPVRFTLATPIQFKAPVENIPINLVSN